MITFNKHQSAHQRIIPMMCELIGAKTYLELGVYEGACLFEVAKVPGIKVTGVDIKPLDVSAVPNITFVHSDTTEYLLGLTDDDEFDVVFIDANHDVTAIMTDLHAVLPHVSDHGLVFLHDTFPIDYSFTAPGLCGSAYKVPPLLQPLYSILEYVTLPYHPGLTIIRNRRFQTAW